MLNDPALRVEEVAKKPPKRNKLFYPSQVTDKQKHLLFMNPGEKPMKLAIVAYMTGGEQPAWTPVLVVEALQAQILSDGRTDGRPGGNSGGHKLPN